MSTPTNTIVSTGFKPMTAVIANGQITGNQWEVGQSGNKLLYVDGDVAQSNVNTGTASDIIVGNFQDLNVPQNAVVTGIEFKIWAKRGQQTSPVISLTMQAVDNSSGTDAFYPYIAPFTGLTTDIAEYLFGGDTYRFATSFTADQVNNFKLALIANGDIGVDSVYANIYYYIPEDTGDIGTTPSGEPCADCDGIIQVQEMALALDFLVGEDKFYLQKGSFAYANGTPVQPGDVGECGGEINWVFDNGKRKVNGSNFEENVVTPIIPDDAINSATFTVLNSGIIEVDIKTIQNRGIQFHPPYDHVATLMSNHAANSPVIISNSARFYGRRFVRLCQAGSVFSEPIETLENGVSKVLPTTKFNFKGSVAVQQDVTDPEMANIMVANGGGTLPPTVVDTTSGTSGGTPSDTITLTLEAAGLNRGALAQISIPESVTVSSALANGNPMTLEISDTDIPNDLREEQYSIQAPTVGTLTIVFTLSAVCEWSAGAETFAGVNQSGTFIGATNSANGTSLVPSVTLNTTVDNSIVVDGLITAQVPILYTPGAGQVSNWNEIANVSPIQGGSSSEAAGLQPDSVIMNYAITQNTDWIITAVEVLGITIPSASGQAAIQFKDEGTALGAPGTVDTFDVTGGGATASRVGNVLTLNIPTPPGTSLEVQQNGVTVETGVDTINVIGSANVTNPAPGEVTIDVTGGSGTGTGITTENVTIIEDFLKCKQVNTSGGNFASLQYAYAEYEDQVGGGSLSTYSEVDHPGVIQFSEGNGGNTGLNVFLLDNDPNGGIPVDSDFELTIYSRNVYNGSASTHVTDYSLNTSGAAPNFRVRGTAANNDIQYNLFATGGTTTIPASGAWFTAKFQYLSGTLYFFIDGVLIASEVGTFGTNDGGSLNIVVNESGSGSMVCSVDFVTLNYQVTRASVNLGGGGGSEKKVGVGEIGDITWENIYIPFSARNPSFSDANVWSFVGGGAIANPTVQPLAAGSSVKINMTDQADGFLPQFSSASGYQWSTPKQALFKVAVKTESGGGTNEGYIGFINVNTSPSQGSNTKSVGFIRDTAGQWYARTADNSAHTETPITISSGDVHVFRTEYDPANGIPQARFYVDGILLTTITTTLPLAAGDLVGWGASNQIGEAALSTVGVPSFAVEI